MRIRKLYKFIFFVFACLVSTNVHADYYDWDVSEVSRGNEYDMCDDYANQYNCSSFSCNVTAVSSGSWERCGCYTDVANVDYYIVGGFVDESSPCNSGLSQWRYRSCASCDDGETRISMADLINLEEGTHFSWPSTGDCGGIEEMYWDCRDGTADCIDLTVSPYWSSNLSDLYICVECIDSVSYSAWTQYHSTNVYVRTRNTVSNCSIQSTVYEYGCKAGTYKVSGSGANTVCNACPTGANCATTNGHTSGILSCKAGYYKSGNSCVACDIDTYQSSNSFTGSSCTPCPDTGVIWADGSGDDGDEAYAQTVSTGSTSVTQCYLSNGTYADNIGTFRITQDQACFYSN